MKKGDIPVTRAGLEQYGGQRKDMDLLCRFEPVSVFEII
jgi:hypothetical protein